MINYTKIEKLNKVLNVLENELTDMVGRFEAQKLISVFCELGDWKSKKNYWEIIFNLKENDNSP